LYEKVSEISVFEFGVAGGNGLVALQNYAEIIEQQTGVKMRVFGFDTGHGLTEFVAIIAIIRTAGTSAISKWMCLNYQQRLSPRTSLV
jgi:hypothetical protein